MPWSKILENVRFSSEKLVKVPLFASDRMCFDVYCVGPGQEQKLHAHDDADKIYVALSGSPTVVVGDEERVLGAMEAAWAPTGVPHAVRNASGEPATLLVFQARTPR
jgi:mannose-6-phosphate isomerase-like protein (cupin superfamily)